MPRFDGTGPGGEGPFTGRGEGYCALRLPKPGAREPMEGYAGLQGTFVQARLASLWEPPPAWARRSWHTSRWAAMPACRARTLVCRRRGAAWRRGHRI